MLLPKHWFEAVVLVILSVRVGDLITLVIKAKGGQCLKMLREDHSTCVQIVMPSHHCFAVSTCCFKKK